MPFQLGAGQAPYAGSTTIYGGQVRVAYPGTSNNINKLNPNQPLYLGGVLGLAPSMQPCTPRKRRNRMVHCRLRRFHHRVRFPPPPFSVS